LVNALDEAAAKYVGGEPGAKPAISAAVKGAIDLYTDHTWKEDYLLFPMSEKLLSREQLNDLKKQFDEVETRFGPDFHRKYEQIVDRLEDSSELK
jgi:hemerythrin-like domain-containing protein